MEGLFQGFDFALENYGEDDYSQYTQAPAASAPVVQQAAQAASNGEVPEHIKKNLRW